MPHHIICVRHFSFPILILYILYPLQQTNSVGDVASAPVELLVRNPHLVTNSCARIGNSRRTEMNDLTTNGPSVKPHLDLIVKVYKGMLSILIAT